MPLFKVKRVPEQVNPPFYQFSCAIIHGLFDDPEFRPYFCKNFSWTSVKTLARSKLPLTAKPAHFQGQTIPGVGSQLAKTAHFQGQTSRRIGRPPILLIFMCYCPPSILVIWNLDLIFVKIFRERPLRP
ncbi:hypothetical protein H5410_019311 [Solanum commersonii]|uniref:Uncharacterized protein n=1 Tax=Solanum commersonii TaxID=4109 RepID=A0A9J5ZAS2_SOLCO|nr:hypothetical protein H5410_019311 [Solanum commersonii]